MHLLGLGVHLPLRCRFSLGYSPRAPRAPLPQLNKLRPVSSLARHEPLRQCLLVQLVKTVRAVESAIPPSVKVAIFRILQEACNNACKHAKARRISVALEADAEGVRLEVADDGVGFNSASKRRSSSGLGRVSMRERAMLTNGCLAIRSQPGAGTRILAAWCTADIRATCPQEDLDYKGNLTGVAAACAGRVFGAAGTPTNWAS